MVRRNSGVIVEIMYYYKKETGTFYEENLSCIKCSGLFFGLLLCLPKPQGRGFYKVDFFAVFQCQTVTYGLAA